MDQKGVGELQANPKQSGFRVLVGEPWPGKTRVEVTERRPHLAFWLCVLLAALLVAYTVYGMVTSDFRIHERVLEVVRIGLVAVVAWVFGKNAR